MTDKSFSPPAPDEDDGLVARLREIHAMLPPIWKEPRTKLADDAIKGAASLITALKAEIAELRANLESLQEEARDTAQAIQRASDFNLQHNTAAAYARGFNDSRDAAKEWHRKRAVETPDAFEMELHRVSAAAIAALKPEEQTNG